MRPRLRLSFGGLRGRLLLALVLTSTVTLGAAAAVVLSPLQQRLRDQSIESLRAAVLAARPRFEDALGRRRAVDREIALSDEAFELSDQTAGRVLVTDLALTPADPEESPPGFLADSESGPPPRQALLAAVRTLNRQQTVLIVRGDDVAVGVPLYRQGGVVGVVVARRRLTEVANAVKEVRRALRGGRRRRPARGGRARGRARQHAAAAARPAARGGAADLGGGPDRVDAAATPATTRWATSRARSRACRRSCGARSPPGGRSWRRRRTSCGRR